jgi:hypothetical protein
MEQVLPNWKGVSQPLGKISARASRWSSVSVKNMTYGKRKDAFNVRNKTIRLIQVLEKGVIRIKKDGLIEYFVVRRWNSGWKNSVWF